MGFCQPKTALGKEVVHAIAVEGHQFTMSKKHSRQATVDYWPQKYIKQDHFQVS
jgi:hypothetical protein